MAVNLVKGHDYRTCRDEWCENYACTAWKDGHRAGYDRGYSDGWQEGYASGYSAGYSAGMAAAGG